MSQQAARVIASTPRRDLLRGLAPAKLAWMVLAACGLALFLASCGAAAAAGPQAVPPEIAKVAEDYANALAVANATEAWNLLSTQSQATTSAPEWQQAFSVRPGGRKPPANSVLRTIAVSENPPEVGGVIVRGQEAFVAVAGTVPVMQQLVLVRESAGWRVDLAASDQINSREAATTFLAAVREEVKAGQRSQGVQNVSVPLLTTLMGGQANDYKATEAEVKADRAQVTLVAQVPVSLVVRAARSGPGWAVNLGQPLLPIDITSADPLKEAAALADRMTCEQQLAQLAKAIRMYASLSGGMLPNPAHWLDEVRAYLPVGASLHCPADPTSGVSYAMNKNLAGKSLNGIAAPGMTVMLYESTLHANNPTDRGETWPRPSWHAEGNLVAYVDASVRPVKVKPSFDVREGAPGAGPPSGRVVPPRGRPGMQPGGGPGAQPGPARGGPRARPGARQQGR